MSCSVFDHTRYNSTQNTQLNISQNKNKNDMILFSLHFVFNTHNVIITRSIEHFLLVQALKPITNCRLSKVITQVLY